MPRNQRVYFICQNVFRSRDVTPNISIFLKMSLKYKGTKGQKRERLQQFEHFEAVALTAHI